MARYKLENALRGTEAKEFDSDEQAWNTLRKTGKKNRYGSRSMCQMGLQGTTTLSWGKVPEYPQFIDICRRLNIKKTIK